MTIEKVFTAEMPEAMVGRIITSFDTAVSDPDNNVASYGLTKQLNDNLTNLGERIDLMNFEFYDSVFLAANGGHKGYSLNLDKVTYFTVVDLYGNTNNFGTYKVENGTVQFVNGANLYLPNIDLTNGILTITNNNTVSNLVLVIAY